MLNTREHAHPVHPNCSKALPIYHFRAEMGVYKDQVTKASYVKNNYKRGNVRIKQWKKLIGQLLYTTVIIFLTVLER
jgi:hypothetical protein